MKKTKEIFNDVIKNNNEVSVKDIKRFFIWYDLLGFCISFHLLFIFSLIYDWQYAVTSFSCVFIILVDSIVKEFLERDPKNYIKLKNELPLVKLWVLPLIVIALISTICFAFFKLYM